MAGTPRRHVPVDAEIERLAGWVATHPAPVEAQGAPAPEQLEDLRACRCGLHTVLRPHFTQEEESRFSLVP
ncbi:hypothetical protein ACH4VX_23555 [Streptomyces sp. NPDC020731]|uniref:hypothetical protein n=1 Tax=Streptomyces sp. NPDC020731 TaxID=3365085 RepID=UPI003796BA40